MKIHITLDVEPAELPLANEIIATLRTLTSNVSINRKNGSAPEPLQRPTSANSQRSGSMPAPVAPPPVSAPPPQPPQPQQARAPPPQPQQPLPPPQQPPPQQQNGRPSGAPPSQQAFSDLARSAGEDGADTQAIAGEISRLLSSAAPDGASPAADAVLMTWVGAFMGTVFTKANVANRVSVVPFMEIIPALSDPWKNKTRDKVIPEVLKHLTIKRPLEVDRMEFFAQAEAFAALVNSGLIGISGAVKTIVALLRKPDNRSAAITCLGKTAELCVEQLTNECDAEWLGKLQSSLALCNETTFHYDLEYINDIMGWPAPGGAPPAAQPPAPAAASAPVRQTLRPVASWEGNSDTIFALAYDAPRRRLMSGSKDSQIMVWDEAGRQVGTPQTLNGCFVCAMDIHPRSDLLLVGGVPRSKSGVSASCVAAYRLTGAGAEPSGLLVPQGLRMLSYVRALPSADGFLTGETMKAVGSAPEHSVVRMYSLASSTSFDSLQPTATFAGHGEMITAISPHPGQPSLFLSGSRDGQVLLWDHRAASSGAVSRFSLPPSTGGAVTCMDAAGSTLLCGTTSQLVAQWDLRAAQQGGGATQSVRMLRVDDTTVLKLAIGPSLAAVAVTTFQGLYLTDWSNPAGEPDTEKLPMGTGLDGKLQHYHDVKWAPERGLLHAGGISKAIATFQLGPA